jgi:hypothetical protein
MYLTIQLIVNTLLQRILLLNGEVIIIHIHPNRQIMLEARQNRKLRLGGTANKHADLHLYDLFE